MRASSVGSVLLSLVAPAGWIALVVFGGEYAKDHLGLPRVDVLSLAIGAIFSWIVFFDLLPRLVRLAGDARSVRALADEVEEGGDVEQILGRRREKTRAARRLDVIQRSQEREQDAAEIVPAVAGLEEGSIDGSYALTKAFVWILPVVGFIGTARGMAHAIRGFSQGLPEQASATMNVDRLVSTLGHVVVPGLAEAFSITMLALTASLIAHVLVTVLERWEHGIVRDLDILSVRLVAPRARPALGGSDAGAVSAYLKVIAEQLMAISRDDPSRRLAQAADTLSNGGQELQRAMQSFRASLDLPYQVKITRGTGS